METSPNHLLNCFRVMFSRKTVLLNITLCFCERKRVKKSAVLSFWGLMKTPMLSSAGFVCLRVGYREVFWEEFSRLT